jgi:hypothetical protein
VTQNSLSLTYPSEKLVETVGTSVTLLEKMMSEVAHWNSVEQHITAAIKNSVDFGWIKSTGCSLHHQRLVDGEAGDRDLDTWGAKGRLVIGTW